MKLKLLLLTFCLLTTSMLLSAQEKKQNIVFILADDLGWKDLQCYGSDFYETPNIDAFARTGMLFTDAYSASPLCSPTRASILTGQEPGRLRFTTPTGHVPEVVLDPKESFTGPGWFKAATPETRTRLPNDYLTFAEVLKDNGYSTSFMGKWHLGREPYIPENQGFDVVVGGREHPGPPPPGHFFAPWNCETLPVVPAGSHISDVLTDEAIKYMKANQEKPFLLCLWYYDVHAPYQAKEDIKQEYAGKLNPEHIQRSAIMGAMIETMDINVGRVLQSIRDLELEDETIVIFTSDNGGNMYDGPEGTLPTNNDPLRSGKGNNYEGGVRVPLIVRVPGMTKSGTTSKVVTSTVDHYASLLELLNIPFPDQVVTDGISYVPALNGKNYERPAIYSTFCHNVLATGNRANISMREGPWKLYKFYFDGKNQEHRYELYNLDEDISETHNLAEQMPDRMISMTKKLDDHAEEAEILLPCKNQNYSGNTADAWFGSANTGISVADEILYINSTPDGPVPGGSEPSIETVFTPNFANTTVHLKFEMKSNSSGSGEVSWKGGNEKEYTAAQSVPVETIHDEKWYLYVLKLPIKEVLKTIRIKPSSGSGEIEIRNIRMETADGYYIRDWPLY